MARSAAEIREEINQLRNRFYTMKDVDLEEYYAEMDYLQKVIAEPALKFCGKCQTFKPNKPLFFRPTQSICRFCERK